MNENNLNTINNETFNNTQNPNPNRNKIKNFIIGIALCGIIVGGYFGGKLLFETSNNVNENDKKKDNNKTDNNNSSNLSLKINGIEIFMPMECKEFMNKTKLTEIDKRNEYYDQDGNLHEYRVEVTDGISNFKIYCKQNQVTTIDIYKSDNPSNNSNLIFPGNTTINSTRTNIEEIYPNLEGYWSDGNSLYKYWFPEGGGKTDISLAFYFEDSTVETLKFIQFIKMK